ncbi:caspase family protein [Massilia sp. LXY-6]|uniref:caspase family protein n=1 Tax=Massilia sp. LXY-6 TaxID=3379823 RepID=UPI003EE11BF6
MRRRTLVRALLSLLVSGCALVLTPTWAAPGRVALVIGNERYMAAQGLSNAGNDARLMARTLGALGFVVTERHDLDRSALVATVAEFADHVPADATVFVYYAGHGMQIEGNNFLNPTDMVLTSERASAQRAYPLATLLERLKRSRAALNVVVLDACRNNPFQPASGVRYRGGGALGLSKVVAPRGTLIAYSTAPGELAPDGKGSNSLYTATLSKVLAEPGRELAEIFQTVGNEVRRQTMDDQMPWYESSLGGSFFFRPIDGATPSAPLAQRSVQRLAGNEGMRGQHAPWYRDMGPADWSQVDWEIQQRMRRLTPDEIPKLERKAHAGSVVAQTTLGLVYREGIDRAGDQRGGSILRFKANNTTAWRWLKKAAAAGFPVAQAEIGEMYYAAHGTERDLKASRYWLQQAAAAHYPRARLDLLQVDVERDAAGADGGAALQSLFESVRTAPSRTKSPGRQE